MDAFVKTSMKTFAKTSAKTLAKTFACSGKNSELAARASEATCAERFRKWSCCLKDGLMNNVREYIYIYIYIHRNYIQLKK